jgi:hypothetical protein
MKITINSSEAKAQVLSLIGAIDLAARPIQTVEVQAFKKDRSSQQNRYYHGVVLKTISDTQVTASQIYTNYLSQIYCRQKSLNWVISR